MAHARLFASTVLYITCLGYSLKLTLLQEQQQKPKELWGCQPGLLSPTRLH